MLEDVVMAMLSGMAIGIRGFSGCFRNFYRMNFKTITIEEKI